MNVAAQFKGKNRDFIGRGLIWTVTPNFLLLSTAWVFLSTAVALNESLGSPVE